MLSTPPSSTVMWDKHNLHRNWTNHLSNGFLAQHLCSCDRDDDSGGRLYIFYLWFLEVGKETNDSGG